MLLDLFYKEYHICISGNSSWIFRKNLRKNNYVFPMANVTLLTETPGLLLVTIFSFIHCSHTKAQAEVHSVPSDTPTALALTYFDICYWFFIKFLHEYNIGLDFFRSSLSSSNLEMNQILPNTFGLTFTYSKT